MKICMFCGRAHTRRPILCTTKAEIMSAYCKKLEVWQAMRAVETGLIDLNGEAARLIASRQKKKKKGT